MKKTILVTGASSGIGEATVLQLLKEGHVVYAAARRIERMQALERAGARVVALDLTDDTSMVALIELIKSQAGRLDGLVNNAGYGSYGSLEDVPLDEARRQFEVNVFGLARLIQLTTPIMRAQRSGTIVNITSIGGKMHEPLGSWYHGTKFAVEGMSDCLRMELAPFGIQVVVIEPGAIKTEWSGIASESLLKYSGATAYGQYAKKHAKLFAPGSSADKMASPPSVVANTISKALAAKRPQTRYATGGGAQLILFLRRMLSDRGFDAVMNFAESRAEHDAT